MPNPYKQANDKIVVPQELIEKTAIQMKQIQDNKEKTFKPVAYMRYAALAAACIIAVVLLPNIKKIINPNPSIFVTKLDEGQHIAQVELVNGSLTFQQEIDDLIIIPPINLSSRNVTKEEWSAAEYTEYLGTDIMFGYLPEGLDLCEESAVVYVSKDGKVISDEYTMLFEQSNQPESKMEVSVSKGKLPPQCNLNQQQNSNISGNPLALSADTDSGSYYAQFIYKGVGYYVATVNISQEEFIKIIYGFFN